MARFLVKASEFKNVCKAVNDRKLAELKKEIIAILKKQDEKEFKKAIDYFESQELHYTHLEKSFNGKWIEKAGYGVGTVRIWKGKKYKKIAPGKWARVFDKEGRGTNIAIGKLIARVQKIDNVEDLMAFVMQNKQRFVDENGMDLPVLDKLRAAVDARNGNVGSKGKRNDNPYEVTDEERKQAMNNPKTKLLQMADAVRNAEEGTKEYDNALNDFQDAREKFIEDQGMEEYKKIMPDYPKGKSKKPEEKKKTFKQEMNELYDAQDKAWEGFESGSEIKSTPENSKKFYDRVKKFVDDNNIKLSKKHYDEIEEMNGHSFNEALALAGAYGEDAKKKELARNKEYSQKYKGQILDLSMIDEFKESDDENKTYWIQDNRGNRLTNEDAKKKIIGQMKYLAELEDMAGKKMNNRLVRDTEYYIDYLKDRLNPEDRKEIESIEKENKKKESGFKKNPDIEIMDSKVSQEEVKDILDKYKCSKEFAEYVVEQNEAENREPIDMGKADELREYSIEKFLSNFKTPKEAIDYAKKYDAKMVENGGAGFDWKIEEYCEEKNIDINKPIESEAEKHQNRSEAMKGNQNAKKYGLTDEQIERYDIQEVVEDVNGYGIVKNSEGKYSYIDDGRVKDRPDDFETSIEKVKERINDTYETKKNIQAAKDYDFKNAKLGSDIEYTKRSDGKHLYFKKSPDGSKAISVTVEVSDMREPLNMTYEVSDTKSGESWQYETAYGNKEGLEWAVEKPEQMEKELKKFFKRDPNKEWDKQNGDYKPQDDVYAPSESADMETKKAIAENKNIGENEVQMPYSKELAAEMESLKNCVSRDPVREFMQRVYYENGNLVATDGRRIKVVKVGNLNGIENGTYVDIDITKNGINIKKNDFEGQFPKYDKVIPDDLSQKVTLNNKVIKDKIKEMKKDGAIDKKVGMVQLEFKDGKVYLDDTEIGEAKNINLKYSDDWGPAREETNIINVNADYLVNALNGNSSTLMLGERADKAMGISTDSTTNIIMPMFGSHEKMDYSAGRSEKAAEKEKKAAELKRNKEYNQELCKVFESKYGYDLVENMASHIDERLPDFSNEDLQREYNRLGLNYDKLMEKKAISINSVVDKKSNMDLKKVYLYQKVMEKHPEVKDKIIAELEKRGISVKKSLFDDFIVDVFAADDEEELEHELYEGETEYNDYSAEQPELFNSTAMKVREALDRIRNQVL
jgi:hypothetical protein